MILKYLNHILTLQRENKTFLPQYRYFSIIDFILQNGINCISQPLPSEIEHGKPKECYKNATQVAINNHHNLIYVEGYFLNKDIGIPFEHAWCIDKNNKVYEVTMKTTGDQYFGVPMKIEYVLKTITKNGYYGILQHNSNLLKGKDTNWKIN